MRFFFPFRIPNGNILPGRKLVYFMGGRGKGLAFLPCFPWQTTIIIQYIYVPAKLKIVYLMSMDLTDIWEGKSGILTTIYNIVSVGYNILVIKEGTFGS